jgi:tRNA(fMet)-specific endonuclease VapC
LARLILDTTILVASERNAEALAAAIGDGDDVAIAAVTVAELLVGVELADRRRRAARAAFVDEVLSTMPVEPYDTATARIHARLLATTRKTGTPRGAHDLMIAATAVETGRRVVTADVRGFADLPGLDVLAIPPA